MSLAFHHLNLPFRHLKLSFHQLVMTFRHHFGKIIKIIATRDQIIKLKCTKYYFGWGSAPDLAGGARLQRSPRTPSWKGPTSKGIGGREEKEGRELWKGRGEEM